MPIGPAILVTTSLLLAGTTPRPWSTGDDRVYVPPGERVPASAGDGMPSGASLIYLNRYGADLARGRDDSRAEPNRSSLLKGERDRATIPEFEGTERDWAEIVACVKRNFQPFNVELTEEDPGPRQHVEAIVGGSPDLIEREADVLGLAPFNCQPIRNAVVLIFSAQARSSLPAGRTVNEYLCEVTSHEIGHAFGLDHSMHASDLMSYLDFPTPKVFQFYDETCGEF